MQSNTLHYFFLFLLSLWLLPVSAQVSKDATVSLTATVDTAGKPGVILQWPVSQASTLRVSRRLRGQSGSWISLLNVANSTLTSLKDTLVSLGQTYEYRLERISNVAAYGYAHVAIYAPVTDHRGKVLLLLEEALAQPLASEISRLKSDLRGDGWQVIEQLIPDTATVSSVKNRIVSAYNTDPAALKTVFLLGSIPIPYAGNTQWDGHPEHNGAWPADTYYADVNGTWTDATVNNNSTARLANRNLPGDGKFDQSYLPSSAELAVGRVDFRRIDPVAFGATDQVGLYRRYLDKDHLWRSGQYATEMKALVDDNFGYFNGEAFAANGFRNAYPLVGENNIVQTDFFQNTNPQRWLLGYGTGGGSYTSANGVGSSSNFAVDTVHIVFSNLFGSYHGDWDFETNPFMPSALASRGGILTCGWAGRPHHYYQGLASGETMGFCMRETLNAVYNPGYHPTQAEGGTHVALLGDPTLRAHIVAPARDVRVADTACTSLTLVWTAAADSAIAGYHVYRAADPNGPYDRLTFDPITDTSYVDISPQAGKAWYSVRSVQRQTSPGGGIYWNTGTGSPIEVDFEGGKVPDVTATGATITCVVSAPMLQAESGTADVTYLWTGPDNFTSALPNPTVTKPGTYAVLVSAAGNCTATATVVVVEDVELPTLSLPDSLRYSCAVVCASLTLPAVPDLMYELDFEPVSDLELEFCNAGQYSLKATSTRNGCTQVYPIEVIADLTEPGALAGFDGPGIIGCQVTSVPLQGNSPTPGVAYNWTGPNGFTSGVQNPTAQLPGTYVLTVTHPANGCISVDSVTLSGTQEAPIITLPATVVVTCVQPSIQICPQVNPANSAIKWAGPGGFTSTLLCITPTSPGVYTVTATHPGTGCTSTAQVTLEADINAPSLQVTPNSVLTCTAPVATLCAESSTPGVVFTWSSPLFPLMDACVQVNVPGPYTCVATALNGCTTAATALVTQNIVQPNIFIPLYEQLDCNTPCIVVQPGTDVQGLVLPPLEICTPGVYTVTATNPQNGCTVSASFEVTAAPPLVVGPDLLPTTLCPGQSLNINLQVSGGTPPYRYVWSTGDTTVTLALPANFSGLLGYTVTDAGGCSDSLAPVNITTVAPMQVQITKTNESMAGALDGTAQAAVTGPTGPFKYLWSNGKTEDFITGLAAGLYTVTVTDQYGCTEVAGVEIKLSTGVQQPDMALHFSLAPNPTAGECVLAWHWTEASPLWVRVYDALGRVVLEQQTNAAAVGMLRLDVHHQPPGVYWVVVQTGQYSGTRRLVVER